MLNLNRPAMSPPTLVKLLLSDKPGLLITESVVGFMVGLVERILIIACALVCIGLICSIFELLTCNPIVKLLTCNPIVKCDVVTLERTDTDDCSICWDSMASTPCRKLLCGHTFHENCADMWHKINPTCALCRQSC